MTQAIGTAWTATPIAPITGKPYRYSQGMRAVCFLKGTYFCWFSTPIVPFRIARPSCSIVRVGVCMCNCRCIRVYEFVSVYLYAQVCMQGYGLCACVQDTGARFIIIPFCLASPLTGCTTAGKVNIKNSSVLDGSAPKLEDYQWDDYSAISRSSCLFTVVENCDAPNATNFSAKHVSLWYSQIAKVVLVNLLWLKHDAAEIASLISRSHHHLVRWRNTLLL